MLHDPCSHRGVAAIVALVVTVAAATAVASSATSELVRQALEHESAHEDNAAVRRYMDALALDPTFGPAYLGLAGLRFRRGDLHEAERIYSMALDHIPDLRAALVGRAHVRRALGALREADMDLERCAMDDDVDALRELARWYAAEGRTAAELASWRRLYVMGLRVGSESSLFREARATLRALQILLGPADPVASPPDGDATRKAIAHVARRGG